MIDYIIHEEFTIVIINLALRRLTVSTQSLKLNQCCLEHQVPASVLLAYTRLLLTR